MLNVLTRQFRCRSFWQINLHLFSLLIKQFMAWAHRTG